MITAMRKDFSKIDIFATATTNTAACASAVWETPEQISVKPVYTADDLKEMEHLDYAAGTHSVLGPSASMQDSPQPRSRMLSTTATLHRDRRDCQ